MAALSMSVVPVILVHSEAGIGWVVFGAGLALVGVLAVFDVFTARVVLGADRLEVHRFGRVSEMPYSEMAQARIETARVFVRLRSDEWHGLPEWIAGGQIMSLRKRLGSRIDTADRRSGAPPHV